MMLSTVRRLLGLLALGVATTSCTSSLELDRFRVAEASSVDTAIAINYFDVRFGAKGMTSHIGESFELRVVDKNNRIAAKAIYSGVAGPDFGFYLGKVVPKANAPYRLDFWADHNNTAKYDEAHRESEEIESDESNPQGQIPRLEEGERHHGREDPEHRKAHGGETGREQRGGPGKPRATGRVPNSFQVLRCTAANIGVGARRKQGHGDRGGR